MTSQSQELMERYIYQVVRRLPKKHREEVRMELEELISDMMEAEICRDKGTEDDTEIHRENSMEDDTAAMRAVLLRLGSPAEFAKKYQDDTHYLIGPGYFDDYLWFLKIVLICTAIPVLAVAAFEGVRDGVEAAQNAQSYITPAVSIMTRVITKAVNSIVTSCVAAFGAVTLIFAILEHQKIKFELRDAADRAFDGKSSSADKRKKPWGKSASSPWNPDSMGPVPSKKALIGRGDSIVGIVFIVLLCMFLIFAPDYFAAIFRSEGQWITIPVFNMEQWNIIMPVFVLSLLLGLVDEMIRLVTGCYCRIVMFSTIICDILQIILSFIVLKIFPVWNPDFGSELQKHLESSGDNGLEFWRLWDSSTISDIIFAGVCIIALAEVGVTVYKTLRYSGSLSESGNHAVSDTEK